MTASTFPPPPKVRESRFDDWMLRFYKGVDLGSVGASRWTLSGSNVYRPGGSVGVGVAPFANSLGVGVDIAAGAGLFGYANNTYLTSNLHFNSSWKYKATDFGSALVLTDGQFAFYTAPSGTAGNTATVTLRAVLAIDGSLTLQGGAIGKGGAVGHHVEAYGAIGDGSTDDTTAITNAIAAAVAGTNGSRTVVFGAKTYRITNTLALDLSSGKSIRIVGETGYVPLLDSSLTNASGTVIDCDFTASGKIGIHITTTGTTTGDSAAVCQFQLENFALKFTGSATDSVGLKIGASGYQINGDKNSRVANVNVSGFYGHQIHLVSARYVAFDNVVATVRSSGTTTNALVVENDNSSRFTGDLTFFQSVFVGSGEASQDTITLAVSGSGAELRGVRFIGCIGYYGRNCLVIYAASGGKNQDIFVDSCQFDGAAATDSDVKTAVSISATGTGTLISGVSISNSYAVQWQDYGIGISTASSATIANIVIDGNYIGLCESIGISIGGTVYGVNVTGNTLFDCGTGGTAGAITFGDGCGLFNCVANTHWNSSATRTSGYVVSVTESGAGNNTEFTVTNNVGHAATAAVFDNTTTGNKTVSGNWMRA